MSAMTDDMVYGKAGAPSLQTAFGFTDAELAENRAGRMSAAQSARMVKGQSQGRVISLVMAGVFVVILIVIAIVVLPPSLKPQPAHSSATPPWIIGVTIAFVAGVLLLSFARTQRGMRGLTGALLSVEGEAKPRVMTVTDANTGGTATMFRVHIGGVNFVLANGSQVHAFDKGRRYRAYYVKGTLPVLLSAEPLDQ
jgi:uncharacterized integral membrane protein